MSTKSVLVPLFNTKAYVTPELEKELNSAFNRVLDSGSHVMGQEVRSFEEEWAEVCGTKYCVGVASGTDALYLALSALRELYDLRYNHPILTTPFTFWATTVAIWQAGLGPKFLDVDEVTGNIPDQDFGVRPALMCRMYGRPGDWRGKCVIEDMAHAHGQEVQGVMGCFSFYPTKNLGAIGQAGAIVTDDHIFYELLKSLREYGEVERFHYYHRTGNHRMDELQAALLRAKLPYLAQWNEERRRIAERYIEGLQGLEPWIKVPPDHPEHVYHIFAIRSPKRDGLQHYLGQKGIQSAARYPVACHEQPGARMVGYNWQRAEKWARENLTLPLFPGMKVSEVEAVIGAIHQWYDRIIRVS